MQITLLSITPDCERLIEAAGRTAYQSFDKQSEGSDKKFIRMLVKAGHTSVLEHAWATVRIAGVSRALTHQLVRHRLAAFTQQSQRYVNESDFHYVTPPAVAKTPEAKAVFDDLLEQSRQAYARLKELGLRNEDARFVLPNAVATEIVMSANLREWRHIIELRGHPAAQWEIREAAIEVLKALSVHAPTVFGDLQVDEARRAVRSKEA